MEGRKILVRTLRATETSQYNRTDFHVVDLDHDEIDRCCFPTLFYSSGLGSMITTDSSVYILGGYSSFTVSHPDSVSESVPTELLYMGCGACLEVGSSPPISWARVPAPTVHQRLPQCAALKGKIYVFGYFIHLVGPEVFDPAVGHWRKLSSPLPANLEGCEFSPYLVTDPANNRILLHLSGDGLDCSPSIYAFYPDPALKGNNMWECIAPGFREWYHIAAVADDVLYFHDRKKYSSSVLGAYDLKSRTWLDVKWTSPFEDNVELIVARRQFHALLNLGPGTLCLACWTRISGLHPHGSPTKIRIVLLKFRADRSGSTVSLTPLSSHSFDLPSTREVENFLTI